jgi:hypothetical protein
MNTISRLVCVALVAAPMAASAASQRVTLSTVKGTFGEVNLLSVDPLEKTKVEWKATGKGNYDDFFEKAARLDAGIIISQACTEAVSTNVKSYARSFAAAKATDAGVKEIVGDTAPDKLSDDQAMALLALKKKKESLSGEESAFVGKALLSGAIVTVYLAKVPDESKALAATGAGLIQSVPSDFSGLNALKGPAVAASLKESTNHLQDAAVRAPEIAKGLTRLLEGLKALQ